MIYDINQNEISSIYNLNSDYLDNAYDYEGNSLIDKPVALSGYKNGTSYKLSEMNMVDTNNIAVISNEHIRNDNTTYKLTPTIKIPSGGATNLANYQCVEYTCNIPTNGENVGLWVYIDRLSKGVFGGVQKNNQQIVMQIQINNSRKIYLPATSGSTIKAGMNYYYFENSEVGNTIKSIKVYVSQLNNTMSGCVYLDSLEVGFRMNTPHVLFNLDCSPNNFYEVGFPLFKKYGLKATLDYHISSTDLTIGAVSDTLKDNDVALQRHNEIMSAGFDYGTYSGWKSIEGETKPYYDDEDNYSTWFTHGERMFKVNNNIGIYAPSTVHCSGFVSGETYQRAMVDNGFLVVRADNCTKDYGAQFVYLDTDNYREIVPYFIWNVWDSDDATITKLKSMIDNCVNTGRNLMIGFHQIQPVDYTPKTNDVNIGYNAVDALLSHVKSYVNQGKLKCSTTAEFVADVAPDVYNTWLIERNKNNS